MKNQTHNHGVLNINTLQNYGLEPAPYITLPCCRITDLNPDPTALLFDPIDVELLVVWYFVGPLCKHGVQVSLVFVRDVTSEGYLNSPRYYQLQYSCHDPVQPPGRNIESN